MKRERREKLKGLFRRMEGVYSDLINIFRDELTDLVSEETNTIAQAMVDETPFRDDTIKGVAAASQLAGKLMYDIDGLANDGEDEDEEEPQPAASCSLPPKEKPTISAELSMFFRAEIQNEFHGGDSPTTLGTAWTSMWQMPDCVLASCIIESAYSKRIGEVREELRRLKERYGSDYKVALLLEDGRTV